MDSWMDVLGWVLAAVMFIGAIALSYFNVQSGGKQVTPSDMWTKFNEAQGIERDAVAAVEQLWQTGQVNEGDRLDLAIQYVRTYLPALPREQAEFLVEAAVYWLKSIVEKSDTTVVEVKQE